jgi:Tfp pilus assembly protein PilX
MMRRLDQRGLVSLFTCIMISLLLLVITVSMISIEALQLRKSEDGEQTLRAYYTAEAGVEDAVSKVLSGAVTTDQTCAANLNYDIPGAAGWTCQQISFSGSPSGKLSKPDQAVTVDPAGQGGNYQSVIFEWNQSSVASGAPYNINLGGGFPNQLQFQASNYAAPPLELQIVEYPHNGSVSAGDVCTGQVAGAWVPLGCKIRLQNAVFVPGGTGAGGIADYATIYNNPSNLRANCGGPVPRTIYLGRNSEYNCWMLLGNLPPNKDFIFRLRSRYQATDYRMTFYPAPNGNGNPVKVPDGTATIDVTAKAGQTFRRVISKLPLNKSAAAGLNYVMYADNDVCKNFDVIDNTAQSGCPYLP